MRKNLTRALCTALVLGVAGVGCTVKVQGGTDKPAAPPPPPPPPPAPKPAPPPPPKKKPTFTKLKFNVKDNRVELPGPVLFETGTATLKPESDAVLDIVNQYLKQNPQVTKHRVEGHTDTDGDDAKNLTLSQERAMAVARWLVSKGIDCKRLVAVGFGETRLKVNPEKTPEDKAANRRVEFVNAELKGKAIGGLPIDGGATQLAGDPCK